MTNATFFAVTGSLAGLYALIAGLAYYTYSGSRLISASHAKDLIKSGDIGAIVDVRTEAEYKAGHYKGAVHIPVSTISSSKKINKLPKDKPILVYCNTGQRARYGAEVLAKRGFKTFYISGMYTSLYQ